MTVLNPALASEGSKNQFIIVDIYFPQLMYTVIEEVELSSLSELMANLGGQMWIWLGV